MQNDEEECDAEQGGQHEMPQCAHPNNHQAVVWTPTCATQHPELPGGLWAGGSWSDQVHVHGQELENEASLQLLRSSYTLMWRVCRL